jgi:hypothetical protein
VGGGSQFLITAPTNQKMVNSCETPPTRLNFSPVPAARLSSSQVNHDNGAEASSGRISRETATAAWLTCSTPRWTAPSRCESPLMCALHCACALPSSRPCVGGGERLPGACDTFAAKQILLPTTTPIVQKALHNDTNVKLSQKSASYSS